MILLTTLIIRTIYELCFIKICLLCILAEDSDELKPPLQDEIKDGQWMGVTVRSQGVGGMVGIIKECSG